MADIANRLPGSTQAEPAEQFTLEKWGTLNTKASRTAIAETEFSYLMNFFPIGDGNLRTLYAEGSTIYGATGGKTIIYRYPFNLSGTTYVAVFLSDGTAVQVRTSDGAVTTITSVAGTFSDGVVLPACTQHGSDNIIIVSKVSTSGYWIWDGSHLFGSGTLSFEVNVSNGGPQAKYTSPPTVTAFGGAGSGATFTATVASGVVTKVSVSNPGAGYVLNDQVVLRFSGGGSDDGAAVTATVTTNSGGVSAVNVVNSGGGFTTAPTFVFTGGGGSGAAAIGNIVGGSVESVIITNPGTGYTSAPTITIGGGPQFGFVGKVVITQGQVTAGNVVAGGTNYQTPPLVTITGDGEGATAHAVLTAGAVSSIVIDNAGTGYTYARFALSGGNNAAQAAIELMPFGVSGDTVELYQQRAWVGNSDKYLFTGPSSLTGFAASQGGGAVPVTDSFTRHRITKFIQNNFLYRLCDSSVNVISNVQTTGTPATTTFNDENVDPQVGTSWPNTVVAFGRATVFANPTGVYALFGGAAQKVSSQLDGLFANASFNTGAAGVTPSAAVFNLFSIKVYGLLFTTIDPYTNASANIIAIWDGQKWFLAKTLNTNIKAIATLEIDSKITAYGDDGTNLFPLFQSPSTSLTKIAQTKLNQLNSYIWVKQVNRFYVMGQSNDGNIVTFLVGIDTERGQGALSSAQNVVGQLQFLGANQQPLTWLGVGGAAISWTVGSIVLYGYLASVYGLLVGTTVTTTASDATLISMTGLYSPRYAPNA